MNEQHVFTKQQLMSLISYFMKGYPNPEDPQPPGPWDPYVSGALRKTIYALEMLDLEKNANGRSIGYHHEWLPAYDNGVIPPKPWPATFGPHPDPWRIIAERHPAIWDVIGGGSLSWAALNPQPLPPKSIFASALAIEVISRAMYRQEIADSIPHEGSERSIIIVGGHVKNLVDEFCGTGFRLKFPIPVPPPPWFSEEFAGMDLIVMGMQFQNSVTGIFNENLQQTFSDAADKLIETGLSRIQ